MYPSNAIGPAAATGISAGSITGGAAYLSHGWVAFLLWVLFIGIAAFTLIGAVGAFTRTLPVLGFLYREPAKKAPTHEELHERINARKKRDYQRQRR
ncbi:MAG: hypothetical protein WAS27_00305 [Candidatus Saccharimonadales bacterium]